MTQELEADSVYAFKILERELIHHGAPQELVALAVSAQADERRHTAQITRLAATLGLKLPAPAKFARRGPAAPRDLLAIATENAREGCVRETYGALLAHYQAQAAEDPRVRATFAQIAPDEARHAELAYAVARWAHARLDRPGRARVAQARRRAAEGLRRELACPPPASWARQAGLPAPIAGQGMLQSMLVATESQLS